MLSCKSLTTLFLFFCLSFNLVAQEVGATKQKPGILYALLLKGMPAPYDTTVAIHVHEYRRIRNKLLIADSLIGARNFELARAYTLVIAKDSAQAVTLEILAASVKSGERLTETNAILNRSYDELYLEYTRPKKIIERPWFWFGAGAIVGIIIKSL